MPTNYDKMVKLVADKDGASTTVRQGARRRNRGHSASNLIFAAEDQKGL
jgi:hypothetical protein